MIFQGNLVIASQLHYYFQVSTLTTIILMLLQNFKQLLLELFMLFFIFYFCFLLRSLCLLLSFLFFWLFIDFYLRFLCDWCGRCDELILGLNEFSFSNLFLFEYFEFIFQLSLLSVECEQTLLLFFGLISLHLVIIFYWNKQQIIHLEIIISMRIILQISADFKQPGTFFYHHKIHQIYLFIICLRRIHSFNRCQSYKSPSLSFINFCLVYHYLIRKLIKELVIFRSSQSSTDVIYYNMSRSSSRKDLHKQGTQQIGQTNQAELKKGTFQQLFVGGLKIKHKNLAQFNSQYKLTKTVRKKTPKSIVDPLETIIQKQLAKVQVKTNPSQEAKITINKITKQTSKKQLAKQSTAQTCDVSHQSKQRKKSHKKQVSQEKQTVQTDFIEKKMKIGHRGKSEAMKQFIIETLLKGKAEGNSLTIHKGTAQCINSPRRQFNKSEIPTYQKEKHSLVLVQQKSNSVAPKRKSFLPPLPHNQFKVNKEAQSKNVSNPTSLTKNKKWVAMAKKMQKKEYKQAQAKQEPKNDQQIIQENIIQENTSELMVQIPEQIQE